MEIISILEQISIMEVILEEIFLILMPTKYLKISLKIKDLDLIQILILVFLMMKMNSLAMFSKKINFSIVDSMIQIIIVILGKSILIVKWITIQDLQELKQVLKRQLK